jgi:MFS family permease
MKFGRASLYYVSYNLNSFSAGLIALFINLFVLATSSLLGVILFNILYYTGLEIALFGCAYWITKIDPKDFYIAGNVIRAVTLISLLAAASLVSNIIIFGLLYGISIGTFWLGNNVLSSDISKGLDRRDFVYRNNLLTSIVSFIAPTLAGLMIEYAPYTGSAQFMYDFAAAFVMLIASAYVISLVKMDKADKPLAFRISDIRIKHDGYGAYKLNFFLSQIFAIPYSILLPIYVFEITGSYTIAGLYGSLLLFVAIFANYIGRVRLSAWGTTVKVLIAGTIASSLLLLVPSMVSPLLAIFVFSVVYTIAYTPLNNQVTSNFMELIDESTKNRVYYWLNREFYIYAGRASVLVAIAVALFESASNSVYLLYSFPLMVLFCVTYLKTANRAAGRPAKLSLPNAMR